jgi:hypothetical protein
MVKRVAFRAGPDGEVVRPHQQGGEEKEGADPEEELEAGGVGGENNCVSGCRSRFLTSVFFGHKCCSL